MLLYQEEVNAQLRQEYRGRQAAPAADYEYRNFDVHNFDPPRSRAVRRGVGARRTLGCA